MKPVATVVAIFVLVLTALPAAALLLAGSALAAPGPLPVDTDGPLSLQLTQVEPRVVTVDGPQTLTVNGVLTNTGDVPVDELEIRVQRGQPLSTEGAVRDALDGNAATDSVQPQFAPLPGELAPGGRLPVRLSVLLRGDPDSSLALSSTGVHELLVNVNGVPAGGARARLAAVRMLLPVLSLPPDPAAATPSGTTAAASTAAPVASPFTLIYPIADSPRRLPTVPGELPLLTDDELAASLGPNGRLQGLVGALATAPVGSPARDATCLAIDPDLVETVAAMRTGYQVLGPDGAPVPGTGAAVAGQWLDGLVAAARGGCVFALPYADADLVALNRNGLGNLAGTALADGRQILGGLLNTPILPLAWPVDGVTDEPTLGLVATAGFRTVLLSADGIEQGRTPRRAGVLPLADSAPAQTAVLTDPLLEIAATGPREPNVVGSARGAVPADTPAGQPTPLSTQDAIGALAFRARSGPDKSGAPVVLAPPHQWAVDGAGATALLKSVDTMLEAGFLTPRALGDVLSTGPDAQTPARPVTYPLRAGGREIATAVADAVRTTSAELDDLRAAAVPDSGVGLEPDEVLVPLTRGLLRPMSAAWRGRPEAAIAAVTLCAGRIAGLRASVRVLEPPSPYALGGSNAPILVTIGNGLPFTVQVRLEISSTSGLRVAPIEMQQVPPLGRRQARVSAEVTRSGQFTVLAAVRSPDGALLGPPSRLRVRSTAYGTITVWLTGSAGVLLVVLAVRRVLRRVRGEPVRPVTTSGPPDPTGPVDPDRPATPAPAPTAPAASTAEHLSSVPEWSDPRLPQPVLAPDASAESSSAAPAGPPTPTGSPESKPNGHPGPNGRPARPTQPATGHPNGDPFPDQLLTTELPTVEPASTRLSAPTSSRAGPQPVPARVTTAPPPDQVRPTPRPSPISSSTLPASPSTLPAASPSTRPDGQEPTAPLQLVRPTRAPSRPPAKTPQPSPTSSSPESSPPSKPPPARPSPPAR